MARDWAALAGASPAALALGAELIARWSEPHRRYHTRAHLAAVLTAIDRLTSPAGELGGEPSGGPAEEPRGGPAEGPGGGPAEGPGGEPGGGPAGEMGGGSAGGLGGVMGAAGDPVVVRLAAWFHDAIYDGRAGWDEERSAHLALARLPGCGVPAGRVTEVARLVRLTAAHDTLGPGDRNGAVLCDADLAVLASPGYGDYTRAIRQEYAHVPDADFAAGRSAVLRRLLATPSLYRTSRARGLWEERARANMTQELARLRALAAAQPARDEPPQQLS
ncbi:metal-dependent phosphohydrolase [Nonomuraea sp. MG754425]|uniref:HD domain-containing protein n=1 Tax=Nonomuraea sp. MG754425 TaxID=2570319 RepID=UPI001F28FE3C|nr:metal-dependent phosphohydrolase [Nonomuraea sp. MG754425]